VSRTFGGSFAAFEDPFRRPLLLLVGYKASTSSASCEAITCALRTSSEDFSSVVVSIAIDSGAWLGGAIIPRMGERTISSFCVDLLPSASERSINPSTVSSEHVLRGVAIGIYNWLSSARSRLERAYSGGAYKGKGADRRGGSLTNSRLASFLSSFSLCSTLDRSLLKRA